MSRLKLVLFFGLLFSLLTLLFITSFTNFFYQDDFFNILLAKNDNLLHAFNLMQKPIMDFYFYRPLTTQTFWKIGWSLFGFNPIGYHLIAYFFFLLNIILVYFIGSELFKKRSIALLAVLFYSFSGSHFYRLYFLSQFQEILLTTMVLLTCIFYLRKSPLGILFFILSLTCKETAIMTPAALFVFEFFQKERKFVRLVPYLLIAVSYVFLRKLFFGFAGGEAYQYNFSPKQIANNLMWYSLWTLGIPEAFVNIKLFSFPSVINPKLFTEFGPRGQQIVVIFACFLSLIALSILAVKQKLHFDSRWILGLVFFAVFLFPILFFPFHKFPYSVTLPAVGMALILALLVQSLSTRNGLLVFLAYLSLFFASLQFNLIGHWASTKAYTSERVFDHFQKNYPHPENYSNIYFRDNFNPYCTPELGLQTSREVSYGIGGVEGLRLLYNNHNLEIYFEDFDRNSHLYKDSLTLNSGLFLRW